MRLGIRLLLLATLATLATLAASYTWHRWRAIPLANTPRRRFDAILVLGCPSRKDGTPTPEQRERTLAGVRAWRSGAAPRIILSGGPAHNRWVEADSMARIAEQTGVPPEAILEERQARNTLENVVYTAALMRAHGWNSVEVVSSWNHLPRASLILMRFPLLWATEASPTPAHANPLKRWAYDWAEAVYCLRIQTLGFPSSELRSANLPPAP